jgi:hypothetical protein
MNLVGRNTILAEKASDRSLVGLSPPRHQTETHEKIDNNLKRTDDSLLFRLRNWDYLASQMLRVVTSGIAQIGFWPLLNGPLELEFDRVGSHCGLVTRSNIGKTK